MAVNRRPAALSRRGVAVLSLAGVVSLGAGGGSTAGTGPVRMPDLAPRGEGTGSVKAIVDPYLRIQEALSADSVDGIKDAARLIVSEATTLGSSGGTIRSAAGEVEQAADLKTARAAFGRLGDAIMIYAKASNANVGDGINVAYCPMARKYWLQKGARIQNPFHGKGMLECGRLSASLPALAK